MRGDAREAEHDHSEAMHCPHCLALMPPASHFCTACGRMPTGGGMTLARTLRAVYGLVLVIGTIGTLAFLLPGGWRAALPPWLLGLVVICFIIDVLAAFIVETVRGVRGVAKALRKQGRLRRWYPIDRASLSQSGGSSRALPPHRGAMGSPPGRSAGGLSGGRRIAMPISIDSGAVVAVGV